MEATPAPMDAPNAISIPKGLDISPEIRALIPRVSPEIPTEITIRTDAEYVAISNAREADRLLIKEIESSITGSDEKPGPKKKAHATWKSLCDLENQLTKPPLERIAIYDKALVAFDDARQQAAAEEAARQAQDAAEEDKQRRLNESAHLRERGEAEGRPDLVERAEQVLMERRPLPMPAPAATTPNVGTHRFNEEYVPTCDNLQALVMGIARPLILRSVAKTIRGSITKPKPRMAAKEKAALVLRNDERERIARALEQAATEVPTIPVQAVLPDLTFLKKQGNGMWATVSKWPGLSWVRVKKPRATGRK